MLPQWFPALDLSEFTCVMIACCVNSTAYVCEIVRAGIQAVDAGQTEAARSLGLNSRQAMIHIVLPQAVKNILPALCNEFVAIVKETSLASTFFIGELMTQFKTINGITLPCSGAVDHRGHHLFPCDVRYVQADRITGEEDERK